MGSVAVDAAVWQELRCGNPQCVVFKDGGIGRGKLLLRYAGYPGARVLLEVRCWHCHQTQVVVASTS
jgi:hypothetical protein